MLRAPRPVPLHHRAIAAQMIKGFYQSLDERWGSGQRRLRTREGKVGRMFVDCRHHPSEMNCTIAISADTQKEVLEAAVQHAIAVHGHQDSPELRHELEMMIRAE